MLDSYLVLLPSLGSRLRPSTSARTRRKQRSARVKALCGVCESVLSPILRSDDASWEAHKAAVHDVTAVLEVNKEVGTWLLRQDDQQRERDDMTTHLLM